jgi:hypothetical protein
MSMSKRILATFLFPVGLVVFCPGNASAQDRPPLQVDLVHAIDSAHAKAGDPIFAKVAVKWQGPQCNLARGAVVQGRIVAQTAHSRTSNTSQIALLFDSGQCDGRAMKPLPLTVAAVLAVDPVEDPNLYNSQSLSDAVGVAVGGIVGGPSGASLRGSVAGGLRSVSSAAATVELSPTEYAGPTSVMPGQVLGIKGVKLNVGGGPEGSSVLTASGHNVRLEYRAQLILAPNLRAPSPAAAIALPPSGASPNAADSVAPGATNEAAAPAEEVDETEICSPPNCSVALAPNERESGPTSASATLSLKNLGYTPERPDHEMYSFGYSSAISYLGPNEMLFTFNPHLMVQRSVAESKFSNLRTIRAVLINVEDKKVVKTVDWKVPDARQYQWSIGQDRVLVHVGRELRLYGPGLKLEQHISLGGPLEFVRTSPSSTYLAVAVVQERHSDTVHRQLLEAEAREPEEDVEIKVLDGDLHVLATVVRSSRIGPPVLSDNGEIRLRRTQKNQWQIVEDAWDGQKHIFATVNSTCAPDVTSLPPDLLFVVGCDRQGTGKWYRVLEPNGKPVLKGWSPSAELEHRATGVPSGSDFAIGIAEAGKSIADEAAFRTSDVANERIAVYSAANGERTFAVTIPSPSPTVQSFALSPDGNFVAVILGDQIAFYKVPAAHRHP